MLVTKLGEYEGRKYTFTQNTFLRFHILFEVGSCKPDFDTLTDMLNGVSKDNLGIVIIL